MFTIKNVWKKENSRKNWKFSSAACSRIFQFFLEFFFSHFFKGMNKEKCHFKCKSFYCNLTRFFQTKQITICTGTIFSLQPTIFRPLPSSRRMNQSLLMHEKTVNDVVKTSFEMHFFFSFCFLHFKRRTLSNLLFGNCIK